MREHYYFNLALQVSSRRSREDLRAHAIGAVAIRTDGTLVKARNGSDTCPNPAIHAEYRVMRKAGHGAVVYVARRRKDGRIGLAKPCSHCLCTLRNKGASKVYYTVSEQEFDCIHLN